MKTFKKMGAFALVLMFALFCTSLASCGDEKGVSGINDYYVEFKVSGGGFDEYELNQFKAELNYFIDDVWEGYDVNEALYLFNGLIKEMKDEYSYGLDDVRGTLVLTLILKTTDGATVKSATLRITNDSCS